MVDVRLVSIVKKYIYNKIILIWIFLRSGNPTSRRRRRKSSKGTASFSSGQNPGRIHILFDDAPTATPAIHSPCAPAASLVADPISAPAALLAADPKKAPAASLVANPISAPASPLAADLKSATTVPPKAPSHSAPAGRKHVRFDLPPADDVHRK